MYDGKVVATSIEVLTLYVNYDVTNMYKRYYKYNALFVSVQKDSSSMRCYDMIMKAML